MSKRFIILGSFVAIIMMSFNTIQKQLKEKKGTVIVGLDYYFNHEYKKDESGKLNRFHYTWEDKNDSGFSMWDSAFHKQGAKTVSVEGAPVKENLKNLNVYIIVDPDTKKETEKPNFIEAQDIKNISEWVKAGGILVLMANDSSNTELDHFNQLAAEFGIKFNKDLKNPVTGKQYEMGKIMIPEDNEVLKGINQIYIKEFASQTLKAPAKPVLTHKGDVVMSVAKVGKGTVFAVGDPWLYNEYANKSRLSSDYQNYLAGEALAKWLVSQSKKNRNNQ
jgi:unsaturated rhamnogalacturonyl hydrolase